MEGDQLWLKSTGFVVMASRVVFLFVCLLCFVGFFFVCLFCFVFLRLYLWHMEVPRLGVKLEL